MESQLTILFENPFWVGIYERIDGDCYQVCKITFGTEPSDREVYEFLLRNWAVLRFSQPTRTGKVKEKKQKSQTEAAGDSESATEKRSGNKSTAGAEPTAGRKPDTAPGQKQATAGIRATAPLCAAAREKESET